MKYAILIMTIWDLLWSADTNGNPDSESGKKEQSSILKDVEFLKNLTRKVKEMQSVLSTQVLG